MIETLPSKDILRELQSGEGGRCKTVAVPVELEKGDDGCVEAFLNGVNNIKAECRIHRLIQYKEKWENL